MKTLTTIFNFEDKMKRDLQKIVAPKKGAQTQMKVLHTSIPDSKLTHNDFRNPSEKLYYLDDNKISLKLKGLISYFLHCPFQDTLSVEDLYSIMKEGKNSIYSCIDEGIEHGYIERTFLKRGNLNGAARYLVNEFSNNKG